MTLRTPRRRISPRTRRRYQAIREFFRRALGGTRQQSIRINSSIAINVTDLKRKIVGLEQQLDEVNRRCSDFACLDQCSKRDSENSDYYHNRENETIGEQTEPSDIKSNGTRRQIIYKKSNGSKMSGNDDSLSKTCYDKCERTNQVLSNEYDDHLTKTERKECQVHKLPKFDKPKTRSVYNNINNYNSSSSFHSLTDYRINYAHVNYPRYSYDDREKIKKGKYEDRKCNKNLKMGDYCLASYNDRPVKRRRNRRSTVDIDPDFITDIIQKQYKPVKMFTRKESDFSQFSAPICRDHEFLLNENILEGSELCSCFYSGVGCRHKHPKPKHNNLNGMRSVCDTRLYSSNKHSRHKHHRMRADSYSNSDMYDLVPVKDRPSPRTRRKYVDLNMSSQKYCKEVPPSPRSLRPRLNLKAQHHTELEDYMSHAGRQNKKRLPSRQKYMEDCVANSETDRLERNLSRLQNPHKLKKDRTEEKHRTHQEHNIATTNSLQYPLYVNEQTSITLESPLSESKETEKKVDNTEKALCEIKDILQNFLHEIKKETVASQCDKSDSSCKIHDNDCSILNDTTANINPNILHNSASLNVSGGQCGIGPYLAPFTNRYCYHVMPVYPINYSMHNGNVVPSQSCTCPNCIKTPKNTLTPCYQNNTDGDATDGPSKTDELIKEIYKFVSNGLIGKQSPDNTQNENKKQEFSTAMEKMMTSRSVGASNKNFHNDVKVGTSLKNYSKSCEALGARTISGVFDCTTTASLSNTVIEKLSKDAKTDSSPITDINSESTLTLKSKPNKFSKILRSLGLFRKKKKDLRVVSNESSSMTKSELHSQDYHHSPRTKPHHRRQDYHPTSNDYRSHRFKPSPYTYMPESPTMYPRPNEYHHDYHLPDNPGVRRHPSRQPNDYYRHDNHYVNCPPANHRSTVPPYINVFDPNYEMQPLCLKEVEVKSTGTQSERKMSIFGMFRKKNITRQLNSTAERNPQNFPPQRLSPQQSKPTPPQNATRPAFTWKSFQAKAMDRTGNKETNPLGFTMKTREELVAGDMKIRNAMIKKIFHKKNPFSPRNMIIKTLLGKDKTSYGYPPALYKPRMFL